MATVDRLRELLLTPEAAAELDAHGQTDAAVLVPLYVDGGALHAVFTKRRDDLRRTALREADEEIGLPPDAVELVGALPPTGTFVTSYKIHPFVGVIEPGHAWTPQPTEVE